MCLGIFDLDYSISQTIRTLHLVCEYVHEFQIFIDSNLLIGMSSEIMCIYL